MTSKLAWLLVALLAFVALPAPVGAQPVSGLWDATVVIPNRDRALEIPFRFELSGSGASVKGPLVHGD